MSCLPTPNNEKLLLLKDHALTATAILRTLPMPRSYLPECKERIKKPGCIGDPALPLPVTTANRLEFIKVMYAISTPN
jgi:hypothetical protein